MQFTFTMRRLLVNLAVLCVVMALILRWPELAVRTGLLIFLFVPAAAAVMLLAYWSPFRGLTFTVASGGALLGWFLAPRIHVGGPGWTWWDYYEIQFQSLAIPMAIGAMVCGGLFTLVGVMQRRRPQ